jgi:Derlin-2/3
MADQFFAELRKIPPVTRFLCASSLGITLPVMLNLLSPYKVLFVSGLVLKRLEASFFFCTVYLLSLINSLDLASIHELLFRR